MADNKFRVLVIEDNPDDVLLLKTMLADHDGAQAGRLSIETFYTDTLASGLEIIRNQPINAVLLSLSLPDSSGIDTLLRVQGSAPHLTIIIMTNFEDWAFFLQAIQSGAQDYLIKGQFTPSSLFRSLYFARERKLLREQLVKQRDFADSLIELAQAIVLIMDSDGAVLRSNGYYENLTGFTKKEVIGENWFSKFVPPDQIESLQRIFKATICSGQPVAHVNPILTKDGGIRKISWSSACLQDIGGNQIGVLAVGLDVTDLLHANAENQLLNQNLERRVEERTQELQKANDDLRRFARLSVNRELRMIELKQEIERLKSA